jgi:tRNA nucleotidyltransferase (CCA-adding enzyme)
MQQSYQVFEDVNAYWQARKVKAESQFQGALHKGKIEQIEAKLDMFYSLPETTGTGIVVESLERELADLHRASK